VFSSHSVINYMFYIPLSVSVINYISYEMQSASLSLIIRAPGAPVDYNVYMSISSRSLVISA